MTDRYQQIVNSPFGEKLAALVGLPVPTPLRRFEPGKPLVGGNTALVLGLKKGRAEKAALGVLDDAAVDTHRESAQTQPGTRYGAIVIDASGLASSSDLRLLYEALHGSIRSLGTCGRIVVVGGIPELESEPAVRAAQRSLEGFVRSLAKELRHGATANLIEVAPGAESGITSALRFLLSAKSAFVCGQRLTVGPPTRVAPPAPGDASQPLAGKVAVVTGAARGIGASIAEVFARDGAHVVCLDLASAGETLAATTNRVGGTALHLDITDDDAADQLATHLRERHGGVDIVVHNAGITRDKTLAGMDAKLWDLVLSVNLVAIERINAHLLKAANTLNDGARIVCVSSMSGIAGNRGQTNYATSKAGLIGHVEALAAALAERNGTINAVAPGFIETDMTAAMPLTVREVGRRASSLGQGGLAIDVAETIAFFAAPDSAWINGTTLRVCGQNLLGA